MLQFCFEVQSIPGLVLSQASYSLMLSKELGVGTISFAGLPQEFTANTGTKLPVGVTTVPFVASMSQLLQLLLFFVHRNSNPFPLRINLPVRIHTPPREYPISTIP